MEVKQTCNKCFGATEIMQPKANGKKGFEYVECTLCNGIGLVTNDTAEDFLLSINEDIINDYE